MTEPNDGATDARPESSIILERERRSDLFVLKSLGFRPGAKIHRAHATFTLEDMGASLFYVDGGSSPKLMFITTVTREPIRMDLETAYKWDSVSGEETFENLFPDRHRFDFERAWVLRGILMTPEDDESHEAEPFLQPENPHYTFSYGYEGVHFGTETEPESFLHVVAIVAYDREAKKLEAIIQRVPSPNDDLLVVPPP